MNKRKAGLLSIVLMTVVAILHFIQLEKWATVPDNILMASRWVFVGSLILFALYKRSLTTWILVAMAIGVEIGLDFPAFSQNLQFLFVALQFYPNKTHLHRLPIYSLSYHQ